MSNDAPTPNAAGRIVCVRCGLPITNPTMAGSHHGPVHRWMEDCLGLLRAQVHAQANELHMLRGATPDGPTQRALALVMDERASQNLKWGRTPGQWPNPDGIKLSVLVEEVGEVARELLEGARTDKLRGELVQVAAVATCWVETLLPPRSVGPQIGACSSCSRPIYDGKVHGQSAWGDLMCEPCMDDEPAAGDQP